MTSASLGLIELDIFFTLVTLECMIVARLSVMATKTRFLYQLAFSLFHKYSCLCSFLKSISYIPYYFSTKP